MKTVLLLGGPAAGQRVEVHGCMRSVMGHSVSPAIDTIYNVVPLLSHGEVHWFGVTDGADPLALLIAGYGGATETALVDDGDEIDPSAKTYPNAPEESVSVLQQLGRGNY